MRNLAAHLLPIIFLLSCGSNVEKFSSASPQEKDIAFDREKMSDVAHHKVEGYWAKNHDDKSQFPFPKSHDEPFIGQDEFVESLRKIEDSKSVKVESQKGSSPCRFGDRAANGSQEYSVKLKDTEVHWPEGYLHYVVDHNVIPSREFFRFVINFVKQI